MLNAVIWEFTLQTLLNINAFYIQLYNKYETDMFKPLRYTLVTSYGRHCALSKHSYAMTW